MYMPNAHTGQLGPCKQSYGWEGASWCVLGAEPQSSVRATVLSEMTSLQPPSYLSYTAFLCQLTIKKVPPSCAQRRAEDVCRCWPAPCIMSSPGMAPSWGGQQAPLLTELSHAQRTVLKACIHMWAHACHSTHESQRSAWGQSALQVRPSLFSTADSGHLAHKIPLRLLGPHVCMVY